MSTTYRRYDIDWLRVIAIGLLLIYHASIGFEPWGILIGFITNENSWESLWIPMNMLNIWRIPLLFFVSGMGVYFALQKRDWKELLKERASRILVPFLVGAILIVPIHVYIWRAYYHFDITYAPGPGHLWFLANIFIYVLLSLPLLFYFKRNESGKLVTGIRKTLSNPLGLLIVMAAFIAEAVIVKPFPYTLYAMTWHGFILGLLAFLSGFCFVLSGSGFWNMLLRWRWLFLTAASVLFGVRYVQFNFNAPNYLLVIESNLWIFSVFAFGYKYLNKPSKTLSYLSEAAYPIYIIHMIFQYLGSLLIFPLPIAPPIQFIFLLIFTVGGCFALYEFFIRRIKLIRPVFGLKNEILKLK